MATAAAIWACSPCAGAGWRTPLKRYCSQWRRTRTCEFWVRVWPCPSSARSGAHDTLVKSCPTDRDRDRVNGKRSGDHELLPLPLLPPLPPDAKSRARSQEHGAKCSMTDCDTISCSLPKNRSWMHTCTSCYRHVCTSCHTTTKTEHLRSRQHRSERLKQLALVEATPPCSRIQWAPTGLEIWHAAVTIQSLEKALQAAQINRAETTQ